MTMDHLVALVDLVVLILILVVVVIGVAEIFRQEICESRGVPLP
jgi:hypothetical protein